MNIIHGDSRLELDKLPDNYFHAGIMDAPYGLTSISKRFSSTKAKPAKFQKDGLYQRLSRGFMGTEWDGTGIEKDPEFWKKVYRVLRPGAYLAVFGGSRTMHRMVCAIEDAGFQIRDELIWFYGQSNPKSFNIEKAIIREYGKDSPLIDEWKGYGTTLKPCHEPICLAKKPISESSIIKNLQKWGTGALNINAGRVPCDPYSINRLEVWSMFGEAKNPGYTEEINAAGKWPSNVITDGSEAVFSVLGKATNYFYTAKPTIYEKNIGVEEMRNKARYRIQKGGVFQDIDKETGNFHPTVKPVALMQWLVALLTRPGDQIIDAFLGSGTTLVAAKNLGRDGTGIEAVKGYYQIAVARTNATQPGLLL
jgi:site-specific DNA-methyltransferase (adenine-specific)